MPGIQRLRELREGGFAVVVLAAGTSSGKTRPKQLQPYLGRPLIEHAARTALGSGACEVVVVVGDRADDLRKALRNLPVRVVDNLEWAEGISSSIRAGVSRLRVQTRAVVISLCDQPRITSGHLRALGERALAGAAIVASSYQGVYGAPCAFSSDQFPLLLELQGGAGARNLIRRSDAHVVAIQFADANEEVDQPDSYYRLLALANFQWAASDPCKGSRDARAPPYVRRDRIAV